MPEIQEQVIQAYQQSQGIAPVDKEKKKKKN
jgi:hypothetical protein